MNDDTSHADQEEILNPATAPVEAIPEPEPEPEPIPEFSRNSKRSA